MKVKFKRWPWQMRVGPGALSDPITEGKGTKYGWIPTPGMGRFGGGWNWKFGIAADKNIVLLDLIFGSVRITWGE